MISYQQHKESSNRSLRLVVTLVKHLSIANTMPINGFAYGAPHKNKTYSWLVLGDSWLVLGDSFRVHNFSCNSARNKWWMPKTWWNYSCCCSPSKFCCVEIHSWNPNRLFFNWVCMLTYTTTLLLKNNIFLVVRVGVKIHALQIQWCLSTCSLL